MKKIIAYSYKIGNTTTDKIIIDKLDTLLAEYDQITTIHWTITDLSSSKTSAVKKIQRDFPEAKNTQDFKSKNLSFLKNIADGVPRKYHLNEFSISLLFSENVHLDYSSGWWINGRMKGLVLYFEEATANKFQKLLNLVISIFGKNYIEHQLVQLTEDEKTIKANLDKKAQALIDNIQNNWDQILSDLNLNDQLHYYHGESIDTPIRLKSDILRTFKKDNFVYNSKKSGLGIYILDKLLPSTNKITLFFDLTPMGKLLSCTWTYSGLGWAKRMSIIVIKNQIRTQFPIHNQNEIDQYLTRIAIISKYLEENLANKIDLIYQNFPKTDD